MLVGKELEPKRNNTVCKAFDSAVIVCTGIDSATTIVCTWIDSAATIVCTGIDSATILCMCTGIDSAAKSVDKSERLLVRWGSVIMYLNFFYLLEMQN